jgi:hypothetical protein
MTALSRQLSRLPARSQGCEYRPASRPTRDRAPLEIGVLRLDSDDPVIIHALPLRATFYRFLG